MATPKGSRKTRIVTLNVAPDALARLVSSPSSRKESSSTPTLPTTDVTPSIAPPVPSPGDKSEESVSTPMPATGADTPDTNSLAPPPKIDGRRKRGGGAVAGRKRAPPVIDPNAPPREKGRPGPKKKPRLPDGTIDRSGETGGNAKAANAAAHKLGPKANTGAINAGLRALDRSGKPCRRWEKRGLQLKSFTGATWALSSWKAPTRPSGIDANGEVKSDSSSELKPPGSSAMPSEKSQSGDHGDTTMMTGMESSPAPVAAT
ncbi:hypothetical protein WHR41_00450 [Cladosporium halotolerans]|uniref:INO80 complex, subunit Ies4 n=1 Tax=Cladosporium halotolerans TaxID=1052096 RepID=A0AB34L7J2_9PEZI